MGVAALRGAAIVYGKSRVFFVGIKGKLLSTLAVGLCLPALAGAAAAQARGPEPLFPVDEVRIGLYDHNVEPHGSEAGVDVKGELLLGRLPGGYGSPILETILRPRPHVGGNLNFHGHTSFAYAGLTWDYRLSPSFFLEASFGAAVHDGPLDERGKASFGCRANFHEQAGLGYAIDRNWRVVLSWEHMSNADLCDRNRGLTNAGLRIGYVFD
jgi:lipid A 3-O-deacylase